MNSKIMSKIQNLGPVLAREAIQQVDIWFRGFRSSSSRFKLRLPAMIGPATNH